MSKIRITTLTPVHVGSGNLLHYNTDFISYKDKYDYLGIVDEYRILQLVGKEHLGDWLLSIDKGEDTKAFVARYAPRVAPSAYLKRSAFLFTKIEATDTLKECLHNGLGVPYLPGSSLKGAIRTAVTATLARRLDLQGVASLSPDKLAAAVEKRLFGQEPQSDIFRFVQVGDAYFPKDCEGALRLVMSLNVTSDRNLQPKRDKKPQLAEVILSDEQAEFALKINTQLYRTVKPYMDKMGTLPSEMETVAGLFALVNRHTQRLVEEEMEIWKSIGADRDGADGYLEQMEQMAAAARNCGEGSCVLRLGHTSGWRFITGAWGEELPSFDPFIVNAARPGNRNKYSEYVFPKSRRADADGDVLGFVKLEIVK